MNKFYCPYCNPKYQSIKKDSFGNLYCGICGDNLIKKNFFTIKNLIAYLSILSIILPMFLLLFFSIDYYRNQNKKQYQVDKYIFNRLII